MEEKKLVRDGNTQFPSNSDKSRKEEIVKNKKEERPKQQPVITNGARKQKKSFSKKFSETFLGDESRNVGDYIFHDVLIPALKSTISDIVTGGIEMLLFGDRRSTGGRTIRDKNKTYVSYNSMYDRQSSTDRKTVSNITRVRHDFDDIVFTTRSEAENVLSHLVDLTIDYDVASVADFYDLSNIESQFTDEKYGWVNLKSACTERVRNGYVIRLPQPRPID